MWFPFHRTPDPRGDAPAHPTPIQVLIDTIAGYISPRAYEVRHQKLVGNPAERQTEQRRIAREEAFFRQGMPVAGHNEPAPKNNPTLPPHRRPRFVP
jgi:hypothetical protein